MSLQRRLLVYLLLCAPLVWGLALWVSADRARAEVNELFDTELIRLTRQMHATLSRTPPDTLLAAAPMAPPASAVALAADSTAGHGQGATPDSGAADLTELAVTVWDAQGRQLLGDHEDVQLPLQPAARGFVDLNLAAGAWRVYYLQPSPAGLRVAAGQRMHEREELVANLVGSQLLPWLLVLPVLLLAMAWAVRQAMLPLRRLAHDLHQRSADDLRLLPQQRAPSELQPLLQAMNHLFQRIEAALVRERRFTADAAHELRTPLAVLRAQWDVQRHATDAAERELAQARLGAGLDRLDRLVSQMLALARVDALQQLSTLQAVDWPSRVETAISDVLPLAERRRIELACDWPTDGGPAFPLRGDPDLMGVLLRNLLDNAVRYAPEGSTVALRFSHSGLEVANDGPALSAQLLARLGERFHRHDGQAEGGSGLGVSIAQRVAALHGLHLQYHPGQGGQGVVVTLSRSS